MDRITVTCSSNGMSRPADVISQHGNTIKVALVGSTETIVMHRKRGTLYVGNMAGLELTCNYQ